MQPTSSLMLALVLGSSLAAAGVQAGGTPRQPVPRYVTAYAQNVHVSREKPYFPSYLGPGKRVSYDNLHPRTQLRLLELIEAGESFARSDAMAGIGDGGPSASVGCNTGPGWIACDFHDFAIMCELSWFDGPALFCFHYGGGPIIP